MSETMRKDFEAWITAPPYEKSTATIAGGGMWPGQYVNYEVQLAWEAFAAARREVETVTREREETKAWAQIESVHSREMLTALNASRAALEDVRRVEEWKEAKGQSVSVDSEGWHALELVETDAVARWSSRVSADSLEALGRALAQEAGDAK